MRQLSTSDWTMVTLDAPHAHNTIGMAGFYDTSTREGGPPTYDDVVEYLGRRLHVAESFRERILHVPLGLDRPYWIRDANFDLEYHVRHIALPKPGTWRQFCTQIARIHSRPLDMTRPPWELYLIDGLDSVDHLPEGTVSAFLRIHHATIDGVAGAQLLTAIHATTPDEVPEPPGEEWTPDTVPDDAELLARAAMHGLTRPVQVVKAFRKLAPQIPMMVRDNRDPDVTSPATLPEATRFNGPVSPHRVFGTAYSTLDTMKAIRKGMPEAKINDIGLAIVGGAMRAYLLDKDELPAESLTAMMPISIRPTLTRSSTVGTADSSSAGGNQFSIAPITMATDEADPFDRLARIVTSTSHVKESGAHPVRLLMEMSEEALGGLMGTVQRTAVRALSRRGRSAAVHTLVSNVPGPSTAMYFCGAKMIDITGLGPVLDGMALNNGIGSYDGRMTFCFTSDREAMPDPEFYEDCLTAAIDELVAGAKKRS